MMHFSIIFLVSLLIILSVYLIIRVLQLRRACTENNRVTEEILRNIAAYVLLVGDDFNVLKTNYYNLTGTSKSAQMPKVGNLLRCRNAVDAGLCGTHDLCASCPVRAAIAQTFKTKRNFSKLEAEMRLYTSDDHQQSKQCDLLISGNYLTIDHQPRLILTVYDITEEKLIQKELEEARLHAEEADRMKSLFLANTSHELRTPLNAIVGFSELLISPETTDEERKEYMQIIRTNNELLLQLVNDTLDLAKIEAGTLEYRNEDIDLNVLMNELQGIFRMKLPENSTVDLRFEAIPDSCLLYIDRQRLMQVLSNLLSNAVKFTHEGEIVFGYEIRESEIFFYVKDTGCGIRPEQQELLFKRFSKINNYKQGVGIGLAISKSIVETMGGHVGVKSEVGKGTKFWFTIPYPGK